MERLIVKRETRLRATMDETRMKADEIQRKCERLHE